MEYNPDMNEAKTVCAKCNGEGCAVIIKGYHITESFNDVELQNLKKNIAH